MSAVSVWISKFHHTHEKCVSIRVAVGFNTLQQKVFVAAKVICIC